MAAIVWTDKDFDRMSWHDNHVHGLRFVEGAEGSGELVFDLDYILEWLSGEAEGFRFKILPATLTFHEVRFPRVELDYGAATAAFAPFMISGVERRSEKRARYDALIWTIPISWPAGKIEFEARGFTQRAEGTPLLSSSQTLSADKRFGKR